MSSKPGPLTESTASGGAGPWRATPPARIARLLPVLLLALLAGCTVADRLAQVGRTPELSPIQAPGPLAGRQPVAVPMPPPEPQPSAGANSLWRSGAKGFFRDQRARRVGDILTVNVSMADKAELSNETSRSRQSNDNLGLAALLGLQTKLDNVLPSPSSDPIDPKALVNATSKMRNTGTGAVQRDETINLRLAATITQVLPNGNLVIQGRQEILVNFEVREIVVAGIVRPEDITPTNTISHEKIAELRFSYGGRGQLTDVQQPRYGAQVLDAILPY